MSWCRCHRVLQLPSQHANRLLYSTMNYLDSLLVVPPVPVTSRTGYSYSRLPKKFITATQQNRSITFSTPLRQSTPKDEEVPPEEEQRKRRKDQTSSDKNPQPETSLVTKDFFDSLGNKSKETFLMAIDVFINRDKHAKGHVEFIYSALKHMKEFGIHRDLDAYKKIVDVFPKGKFIATNMFQVEFMHFPKQQQCAIDLLEQMEILAVYPDSELEKMFVNIFGHHAHPLRKLRRMLYWMPKFKNLSPWPIPDPLPEDALGIAKLAIERITSVDLETKVSTFYPMEELEDSIDPTWIVSGQSATQQRLIEEHAADKPIYVEGAFRIWLRSVCINYFILRTEPKPVPKSAKDKDDVGFLSSLFTEDYVEKEVANVPSVHEQEDGVILAVCATGTSSHDSVLSWIRFLERTNPRLGRDISILFTLKSPLGPTDDLTPVTVTDDTTPHDGLLRSSSSDVSLAGSTSDSSSSSAVARNPITLDPRNPELTQLGIDADSDTQFINWPHHYNKNKQARSPVEPLEKKNKSRNV